MSMPADRFDELVARLERMESFLARLGFDPKPPAPPPRPASGRDAEILASMNALKQAARDRERATARPSPPIAEPTMEALPVAMPAFGPVQPDDVTVADAPAPPPIPLGVRHADPSTHLPSPTLEQAIGLKVAGWIGAVVLVIGGAMGVKYAYDMGWLGGVSDEVKLGLLYAIGLAILGVGEFVHRRVAPLAAVGIFGAGIAMLFVVGYAGNAYYALYEQHTTFGLMAGACAIGFVIALRGRLVSIAVLSLIGANVAPLVLRQSTTGEASLLAYLLILQLLALSLAHVGREGRWWVLRTLSLVTTSLWLAARLFEFDTAYSLLTIEFAVAYAATFQAEVALTALRRPPTPASDANRFSLAAFSFVVTSLLTTAFLFWSSPWPAPSRAMVIALMAGIALAAGAIGWMRRSSSKDLAQLVASWFVQAATLLFVAIPVALAGPWLIVGWALLGVGYAAISRLVGRRGPAVAGALSWAVALGWLVREVGREPHRPMADTIGTLLGTPIPMWFGVACVLVACGHAIALLTPRLFNARTVDGAPLGLGDTVSITATAAGVVATLIALPSLGATASLVVFAWLAFATGALARREAYAWQALCVATAAATHWLAVDVIVDRLSAGWTPQAKVPFLNATIGIGLLAVGSAATIAWLSEHRRAVSSSRHAAIRFGIALAMIFVSTIALSVEVERAVEIAGPTAWPSPQLKMFGFTVLWLAAVLLVAPLARLMRVDGETVRAARRGVAVAVGLITIKFLGIDSLLFAFTTSRVAALPFLNAHTVTGLFVLLSLAAAWRLNRNAHPAGTFVRALVPVVPLVVGSIELDRLIGAGKTLVGLSIFWGVYAIATILAGFGLRSASIRIGGLVLLGITLVKIVLLDLAQAGTGLRILSFLGVGIVLLITSVLYGKLSPLILQQLDRHRPPAVPVDGKGEAA